MMDDPAFKLSDSTIAIVGLGLMGGSLALAWQEKKVCAKIIGIDRNEETRTQAMAHEIEPSNDLNAVSRADLIILATPVRTIIQLIPQIGALVHPNAIVMDLGSTKREIVSAMNSLPAHVQAVGAHPMCGKEHAGFDAADANLFRNATFVLTPLARTSPQTLALAQSLVEIVGARPLILDAERHDKIVAEISHLPYVIATALMQTASEHANADDLTFTLAASGFRDTSRLAASDTAMTLDILMTNRDNVASAIRASARNLDTLADSIERGDELMLQMILQNVAEKRRALFTGTMANQKSEIEHRKLS